MKAIAMSLLTIVLIGAGSPAHARALDRDDPRPVASSVVPSGTIEYDAFVTTLGSTLKATGRNWQHLNECRTWACYSTYHTRIEDVLTQGIHWMYQHPALACYQEQQGRATKGLQELRGGFRLYLKALGTGTRWRIKAAQHKVEAAGQIFESLPGHVCPA